jgi:hypothetical protein
MKTATFFATIVASATAFAPVAQQQSSTALNMAGYQDRFYPKPTGGMSDSTMGWKMPETVERGPSTRELESAIPPYGTDHQNNARGGTGPLGQQWTTKKSTVLRTDNAQKKPTLKPYGEIHQANGKGGKGPLGKDWTTKMDQTYKQGQERFHPFN